jgi:hypothetical protein
MFQLFSGAKKEIITLSSITRVPSGDVTCDFEMGAEKCRHKIKKDKGVK